MDVLTLDERACIVEEVPSELLTLRLVDHAWCDAVDAYVKERYEVPLEEYLSHLRIRGRRPSWLLRYATVCEHSACEKARGYVCAKCGAGVRELGSCRKCRTRRMPVVRLAATCVTATLLVIGITALWWWRASNSRERKA